MNKVNYQLPGPDGKTIYYRSICYIGSSQDLDALVSRLAIDGLHWGFGESNRPFLFLIRTSQVTDATLSDTEQTIRQNGVQTFEGYLQNGGFYGKRERCEKGR
jgi:hypothetical protein